MGPQNHWEKCRVPRFPNLAQAATSFDWPGNCPGQGIQAGANNLDINDLTDQVLGAVKVDCLQPMANDHASGLHCGQSGDENRHGLPDFGSIERRLLFAQQSLQRLQALILNVFGYLAEHFGGRGAGAF